MADEFDAQEKTEEPSQYRLEEFRTKGNVAASREINHVLVLGGTVLALILSGLYIYETVGDYIRWIYTLDIDSAFTNGALKTIVINSFMTILKAAGPVLLVSFIMGILANLMQVGVIFAPEVISFNMERVNPLSGLQKILSMKSLMETVKAVIKLTVICSIAYSILKKELPSLIGLFHVEEVQFFTYGKFVLVKLFVGIIIGLAVIAVADLFVEKYQYRQKLKLSKPEAKQELKEKEGNPEIKQRIRTIQREIYKKRMMKEIKKADVIVTNPTHLSIAIAYDKENMVAPRVVGKGSDHLALVIRQMAKANDIPIVENVGLARTLYKTVKVGQSIPRNLYKAVAEILAFVYKLRKKSRALSMGAQKITRQMSE